MIIDKIFNGVIRPDESFGKPYGSTAGERSTAGGKSTGERSTGTETQSNKEGKSR